MTRQTEGDGRHQGTVEAFARFRGVGTQSSSAPTSNCTASHGCRGSRCWIELFRAADGLHLHDTRIEQLVQAMAAFGAETGLSWSQAAEQRPQEVEAIPARYWQPESG